MNHVRNGVEDRVDMIHGVIANECIGGITDAGTYAYAKKERKVNHVILVGGIEPR